MDELRVAGRILKQYAEPVGAEELQVGDVYFSVTFLDDQGFVPLLEPVVFLGRNLEPGDAGRVWFQDFESYSRGTPPEIGPGRRSGELFVGSEDEINHFFTYERALDVLLRCSLERARRGR